MRFSYLAIKEIINIEYSIKIINFYKITKYKKVIINKEINFNLNLMNINFIIFKKLFNDV